MFGALRNGRDGSTPGLGRRLEMGLCSSAARRQGAYRMWIIKPDEPAEKQKAERRARKK